MDLQDLDVRKIARLAGERREQHYRAIAALAGERDDLISRLAEVRRLLDAHLAAARADRIRITELAVRAGISRQNTHAAIARHELRDPAES